MLLTMSITTTTVTVWHPCESIKSKTHLQERPREKKGEALPMLFLRVPYSSTTVVSIVEYIPYKTTLHWNPPVVGSRQASRTLRSVKTLGFRWPVFGLRRSFGGASTKRPFGFVSVAPRFIPVICSSVAGLFVARREARSDPVSAPRTDKRHDDDVVQG